MELFLFNVATFSMILVQPFVVAIGLKARRNLADLTAASLAADEHFKCHHQPVTTCLDGYPPATQATRS